MDSPINPAPREDDPNPPSLRSSDPHCLPQTLDLTAAQSLQQSLLTSLGGGAVILDASAVERMSTPCVQVLLAAGRAADLAGSPLQIIEASDVFRAALADLGLQAEFKNWMA